MCSQRLIFFIFIVWTSLVCKQAGAASGLAIASGEWNSASSWSFGGVNRIPSCGDTIAISSTYTITVNSQNDYTSCGAPMVIYVYGTLQFTNGNKLSMPCNSWVYLQSGGIIKKATAGGGNSTYIEICNEVEWSAGDGTLYGPATLGGGTLPVTMLNFSGEHVGKAIVLNWSTNSEVNNDYFTVERSTDGHLFSPLAIVNGAGTSSITHYYKWNDLEPYCGIAYYRIKQTDFDGQTTVSKITVVSFKKYLPRNPVEAYFDKNGCLILNIETGSDEICRMNVYGPEGNILYQEALGLENDSHHIEISIPHLPSGIYFVKMNTSTETFCKKIIRVKNSD